MGSALEEVNFAPPPIPPPPRVWKQRAHKGGPVYCLAQMGKAGWGWGGGL